MPALGQRNLELRDVLIRKNCNITYTVGFMRLLVVYVMDSSLRHRSFYLGKIVPCSLAVFSCGWGEGGGFESYIKQGN